MAPDGKTRARYARRVSAALLLLIALFLNVTATFVHSGEDIPVLGFVFGTLASFLIARLVFAAMGGQRVWRWSAAVAGYVVAFTLLTVGLGLRMNGITVGSTGTRIFPFLVSAEGLYLRVVPEPTYYHEVHRDENVFYARLVRALHSCDERRILRVIDEAATRYAADIGRTDLFVRIVLTRFIDEGWCSPELRRQVQERGTPWVQWYRRSQARQAHG